MIKVFKIFGWLLGLILLVTASFIIIYWVPDRSLDELKPRWAQAPSAFVELAGMQVHLRDEGPRDDPIPILLLHGTSASLHTWEAWVQLLKNEHRLIRLDLPGFGLTGPAPDNEYSIEKYAQLLIVLLDYLQVDQVILVGNSLGGNVAWNTAFINPAT
jgi:pimeloyl-ACP methyl ester carboxylesterase